MILHMLRWLGFLSAAALAGLAIYNSSFPSLPGRAGKQTTFPVEREKQLPIRKESRHSPKKLPAAIPSPEEPAWLIEARNDPDPRVRLNAIEAWASMSGTSLDPITYALVDPDESVRARAQELLEEKLSRR